MTFFLAEHTSTSLIAINIFCSPFLYGLFHTEHTSILLEVLLHTFLQRQQICPAVLYIWKLPYRAHFYIFNSNKYVLQIPFLRTLPCRAYFYIKEVYSLFLRSRKNGTSLPPMTFSSSPSPIFYHHTSCQRAMHLIS